MTPDCFQFFADFLNERSGLSLQLEKQYLLENRLAPLLARHGFRDFNALSRAVQMAPTGDLAHEVVESMTVTETSFFRDRTPFDLFTNVMLPEILNRRSVAKPLRIWSAAASSGQEAYTLAMLCRENAAKMAGHRVEIIATDLSSAVLEKAKAGFYSQFEVQRGMPVQLLLKYFEQSGDMWQVKPEIRSMVTFQPFNLMSNYIGMPTFDIIFCRNVLIYFNVETKRAVFKKLRSVLSDDGYLVLGGAETAIGLSNEFAPDPAHRSLFRVEHEATAADTLKNFASS